MSTLSEQELKVHLPRAGAFGLDQDEEFFEVEEDGERRRIRCHDYGEIYSVPGLYERIFTDVLSCRSPEVVVNLLEETLVREDRDPKQLRVFDLGAGNGMVAEELDGIGADSIVGVDLLEEAKEAAERDRPGLYDAYHAIDLTELDNGIRCELESRDFNCLTCVAALGFGDIPAAAFRAAYDLVAPSGWVAFNIRDQFLDNGDASGFARLLDSMLESGELKEHTRHRYQHRVSVNGDPLHYIALVAQKAA
jgi:SAM-dependent methyltransferase